MFDYKIGIVLLVIAGVLIYASMGEWLVDVRGRLVFFRKRPLSRIASGVWGILWLWLIGFSVVNPYEVDPTFAWMCVFFGVLFACAALYGCGPADVSIDLDARMYHATTGWIFAPRSVNAPLTNAAALVVSSVSNNPSVIVYSVSLWTQSDRKNSFPLAVTVSGSDAQRYAGDISRLINVPVR